MKKPKTMTPAEQRVAIAKDALAWIEAGALKPMPGVFVSPVNVTESLSPTGQLRDAVLGPCEVCAIGAMFIAKAVRFDEVTTDQYRCGQFHEPLRRHFDAKQLALIETAFEGQVYVWNEDARLSDAEKWAAHGFYAAHVGASSRLTAILRNIIANDGTFIP